MKDYNSARGLAAIGIKEGTKGYCVQFAEQAIELVALVEETSLDMTYWFLE